MDIDDINSKAFFLVQALNAEVPLSPSDKGEHKSPEGSQDYLSVTNLGEVDSFISYEKEQNSQHVRISEVHRYKHIYKFDLTKRDEVDVFLKSILLLKHFCNTTTFEFIEKKFYDWAIEVKLKGLTEMALFDYLIEQVNKSIKKYSVEYRVANLHIGRPFTIGDVEFNFYTKQYFEDNWPDFSKHGKISKEEYEGIFSNYSGHVFVRYSDLVEKSLIDSKAFYHCGLAIDVLKMFSTTTRVPAHKCLMDIENRINTNLISRHFIIENSDFSSVNIITQTKNQPENFSNTVLDQLLPKISVFSKLLKKKELNEVERLVLRNISFYSHAISTDDLHLRASFLISIIESLLLEEDRKYKMEDFTKKRFVKLLHPDDEVKSNLVINKLSHIYQIRHKTIHKGIRLLIDMDNLKTIQISIVNLFAKIIKKAKVHATKGELISSIRQ